MSEEEKLLPIYDKLYAESTLKFKGKMLDPAETYDNKLKLISGSTETPLAREELARIYYWLTERYKREQKSQRESIPNKYKSEEFKKYEKWEKEYDPARHSIYNSRRLTDKEIEERGIKKPGDTPV